MGRKYFLILFLSLAVSFLLISATSNANSPSQQTSLEENFLDVAFSDNQWGDDHSPATKRLAKYREELKKNPEYLLESIEVYESRPVIDSKGATWWRGFLEYDGDFPKSGVINKWSRRKVGVSCGWPSYGAGSDFNGDLKLDIDFSEEMCGVVEHAASLLAPIIKAETGIELVFLEPYSSNEQSEKYALIRVLDLPEEFNNLLKSSVFNTSNDRSLHHDVRSSTIERLFLFAVPFTFGGRAQVEGYLLPNTKNEIDMSVCKISPKLDTNLTMDLMGECLLRSLGIPELLDGDQSSIFGAWNKKFDDISFLPSKDGFDAARKDHKEYLQQNIEADPVFFKNGAYDIPEGDKALLKLLYCPEVKAGFSKQQVLQVADKCGVGSGPSPSETVP